VADTLKPPPKNLGVTHCAHPAYASSNDVGAMNDASSSARFY
jgi:hypothetical protein